VTKLVRYVCAGTDHQQLALFVSGSDSAPNTLTFREGAWAYCPKGAASGHEWREIADRPFNEVREEIERAIGGSAGRS
jgi:hypothetical protein